MARCTTPLQHIYNKLRTIYHHCDINDCISVNPAGSPSSSTSASVATDNCDPVENVAFYINMMAHPNTRLPMPTSFDGNTPPFLEWTSEVRGFLQLNDFGFLVNLDTAFNEVNPVSLNDIYTARDDTEAIDRGITQHNEGLAALNEELAQRDQPVADGQPARRAATAINTDIANVNGQRDALIAQRNTIKRDITRASQYLTYIMVHATKPNSEVNNMVRQLQGSENGFEIWRQLRQRFSGGQRAQQLQLLQRIMNPKWTEAQQGQQFNQWLIDISRYELETATPIEESIKIATAINNLRGAVRQHLLLSVRPTTTWREVHNIAQNFLVSTWLPQEGHISTIEDVNYIKKGKGKGKRKGKGKGKPNNNHNNNNHNHNSSYNNHQHNNKGKGKKGKNNSQQHYQQFGYNNQTSKGYNPNSGKGKHNNSNKGKGKFGKGKNNFNNYVLNDVYCYFCGKRGHYASSCWSNPNRVHLVNGQHQRFDLGQQDQPVTHIPPEHLRVHNLQRQSAPSTSSIQYVSTPGPVVHDIPSASSINNGIFLVDVDINMVNKEHLEDLRAYKQHWALLCDTGAVSSIAPITFCPEIQLQPLDARVQLSTANGDSIKMFGYKDVDIFIGGINMYVRFYICDVSAPILGVNDLVSNNVELNLRNFQDSYLQQHDQQAFLQYIGRHFYIPAIVTEANKINVVWQTIVQQEFFDDNTHYCQLFGILASDIELEDSNVEARPATTLRSPTTPSPQRSSSTQLNAYAVSQLVPHLHPIKGT